MDSVVSYAEALRHSLLQLYLGNAYFSRQAGPGQQTTRVAPVDKDVKTTGPAQTSEMTLHDIQVSYTSLFQFYNSTNHLNIVLINDIVRNVSWSIIKLIFLIALFGPARCF